MSDIVALQKQIKDLERRLRIREREQGKPPAVDTGWQSPSYSNSWEDFSGSLITQYRLLTGGIVVLNIHVKNGTNNTVAFNMASKYRPQQILFFPAIYNNTSMARVVVSTNGSISLYHSGGIASEEIFAAQCVYSTL